ncbi:hypothetical protein [Streptomyces scabichelini]|uniref:hypothetical protein n=1 Tax=Streptomyces scabichelini TaxID=2711217 RepID=UPI0030B9EEC6
MEAAALFDAGLPNAKIAKRLRVSVSVRSMQRWLQAWEHLGPRAACARRGQRRIPN